MRACALMWLIGAALGAAADDGKTQRFVDVVNALASVKISSITMTGFREDE